MMNNLLKLDMSANDIVSLSDTAKSGSLVTNSLTPDDTNKPKSEHRTGSETTERTRKRKSRWSDKVDNEHIDLSVAKKASIQEPCSSSHVEDNPSVSCDNESFMRQVILCQLKAKALAKASKNGQPSNEYDSDEDTEGGTFEHKQRLLEMQKTNLHARQLTVKAEGKHHLAQFLPEDEQDKLMEALIRATKGEPNEPSSSATVEDYVENKLQENNAGFKMLQKMGWRGKGLGANEQGVTTPVNKGKAPNDMQGLGAGLPNSDDDIFDMYRKRMMQAYKYRPNPLNNPRRPYY